MCEIRPLGNSDSESFIADSEQAKLTGNEIKQRACSAYLNVELHEAL